MTKKIDPNLIHRFRYVANKSFIIQHFSNNNGKNKWNIICSAMDWIDVAVEGLLHSKVKPPEFGHNSMASLNLMQYIVTVDILVESILQLYRVICGEKKYPLQKDKTIFKQTYISDDKYFKQIRAVFGTHPVNLTSVDGYSRESDERFYASWSSAGSFPGDDADFLAVLYSNKPGKEDTFFSIKIEDINNYAEKRYNLLSDLAKEIVNIQIRHTNLYKNRPIPSVSDPLEQLDILLKENVDRMGEGYGYSSEIKTIYSLLSVKLSTDDEQVQSIVEEYRVNLESKIARIKRGLEDMEIKSLGLWPKLAVGYEYEKIYNYLTNHQHQLGEQFFIKLIEKNWLPKYLINCTNFDEMLLVLNAFLYRAEKKGLTKYGYGLFPNP